MTLRHSLSRLAAVALLLGLIWAAWSAIGTPIVLSLERDRASIAVSRNLLLRYDRMIKTIPELQHRLERGRTIGDETHVFLTAATPALMAAGMQSTLQRLIDETGADIRSSRTIAVEKEGALERVGLDLELTASSPCLQRLLYRIETSVPLILVDRLFIRAPQGGVASVTADGQPGLSISMRVSTYARPGQISASP